MAIKEGYRCEKDPTTQKVTCSYDHNDTWYVELVCSSGKGVGLKMFTELKNRADMENISYITLSALPRVVMYYYDKLNFRFTMDRNCYEERKLSKIASALREHLTGRRRQGLKTDPFTDTVFVSFLIQAVSEGLGMSRNYGQNCRGARCAEDGVYMTLCLQDSTMNIEFHTPKPTAVTQPTMVGEFF